MNTNGAKALIKQGSNSLQSSYTYLKAADRQSAVTIEGLSTTGVSYYLEHNRPTIALGAQGM